MLMNEGGTRPGGLTALAVINFIIGGFGILGAFGTLVTPTLMRVADEKHAAAESRRAAADEADAPESAETRSNAPPPKDPAQQRRDEDMKERMEKIKAIPFITFVVAALVEGVIAILMITSGIGYLKVRRFLGRTLGTVYALLSIAWACVQVAYTEKLFGDSFKLLNLIGFIYPAITLLCLRFVFKDDFINP
jgi:hypothetical protein